MKKILVSTVLMFATQSFALSQFKPKCAEEAATAILNYLESENPGSEWHLFKNEKNKIVQLKDINSADRFEVGPMLLSQKSETHHYVDGTLIVYAEVSVEKSKQGERCHVVEVGFAQDDGDRD